MTPTAGARPSFTEEVRQELSRLPVGGPAEQRAELAALLQLGGERGGSSVGVVTRSGAVARRTYGLLVARYEFRPEITVRARTSETRSTYLVRVTVATDHLREDLDIVRDTHTPRLPDGLEEAQEVLAAYLRGALLAAGSISAPGRSPHLEIAVGTPRLAAQLADRLQRWLDATVTAVDDRHRVVIKSGASIGDVLGRVGATNAYLRWEERQVRGQVRAEATRLANADAANLRRTIEAAAEQTRAVEAAIDRAGWEALDDDLRQVALARLANPAASLAELGELCDPPVGKSAVHRRLQRLTALGRESQEAT